MTFRYENNTGLSRGAFQEILDITDEFSEIEQVKLFGKRVQKDRYNYKTKIELALFGKIQLRLFEKIEEEPDCLIYKSATTLGARNFLFFEKGYKKLALREVKLSVGEAHNTIQCASSTDYIANLESYGKFFEEKAKVKMNDRYLNSEEYKQRKRIKDSYLANYFSAGAVND